MREGDALRKAGGFPLILVGLWLFLGALLLILSSLTSWRTEDLQTLSFPFFLLLLFVLVPAHSSWKIPKMVFALAALLWLMGASAVRLGLWSWGETNRVVLFRLDEDRNGFEARGFITAYQELVQLYQVPPITPLQIKQSTLLALGVSRSLVEEVSLFVRGTKGWLQLSPHVGIWKELRGEVSVPNDKHFDDAAERLAEIVVPGTDTHLLLVLSPGVVDVPVRPINLSRHFLAWFAQAFAPSDGFSDARTTLPKTEPLVQNGPVERALREHFLQLAADVDGHWQSHEPRGAAHFFRGVLEILGVQPGDADDYKSLRCAIGRFRLALNSLPAKSSPEFSSAAFNNAAVAEALKADSERELKNTYRWLLQAAETLDAEGRATLGSRAALYNLMRFRELGVLDRI